MADSLLDQPTVYGARAKLGVIVPPTNTANEAEWNRLVPPGVSVHAARMPLHVGVDFNDADAGRALCTDVERFATDLAQTGAEVIAYGCTAGSMVEPVTVLADLIRAATGRVGLTTAQAIVAALRALGVRRLAVATPYHAELNGHERAFLDSQGFRVTAIEGLGYGANGPEEYRNIARVVPQTVIELARRVDRPEAEALLLSCTDLATLEAIPVLERELGKPVISSNSATFWLALRSAGIADRLTGAGALLERH